MDVIGSAAEKEAAVEFSRAEAVRPRLVGQALAQISRDREVLHALMDILETQRLVEGKPRSRWSRTGERRFFPSCSRRDPPMLRRGKRKKAKLKPM